MGNRDFTLLSMCATGKKEVTMQVVVPIWILALYHAVAYAGAKFGGTQLWQQYGARLQQGPVCISGKACCHLTHLHPSSQAMSRMVTPLTMLIVGSILSHGVQGQALVFNAGAEIGVGFLLLVGLVTPQRSLLLTFIYWKNFLPTRYHTPDAAGYHRQAKPSCSLAEGAS